MNFSFDFNFLKNGAPIVTLSSLGLAFNRGAIDMLGAPDKVVIGYDERNRAIGVCACPSDATVPCYEFASRVKNDWVRIGAKDFSKYLSRVSGIDFLTKAKQFIPEYDEDNEMLIVIVDEDHLK